MLYRVAEMLEGRRDQFVTEVAAAEGVDAARAGVLVDAAIDRWVWYAGWTDKVAQVAGSANPVAGPYFNLSVPEPTGVVAVLAPQASSLLGLVSVLAPVIVTGNAAVVLASQERPLPAVTLSEVLATSDVPGGVVNVLTGSTAEVAPWLASHEAVRALDLAGATAVEWGALEAAARRRSRGCSGRRATRRPPSPPSSPTGRRRRTVPRASSRSPRQRRSGTPRAVEHPLTASQPDCPDGFLDDFPQVPVRSGRHLP